MSASKTNQKENQSTLKNTPSSKVPKTSKVSNGYVLVAKPSKLEMVNKALSDDAKLDTFMTEMGCRPPKLLSVTPEPLDSKRSWSGLFQRGTITVHTTAMAAGEGARSFFSGQKMKVYVKVTVNGIVKESWCLDWENGEAVDVDWKQARLTCGGTPISELVVSLS